MDTLKLNFEIVPTGAWNNNLRTVFSKKAWDFIRKDAYARAGGKCSICGRPVKRLEAHERWSYNKQTAVQKLEDVIAVCHAWHSVIHIGRTQLLGDIVRAEKHFMKVNNATYVEYRQALGEANKLHQERNKVQEWKLDLTWLNQFNK